MDELTAGTRVGDYRIEHELGRGGTSVVYAATHLTVGKRVALKVVRSLLCAEATGRVRASLELRATNQIAHPNIVDLYGHGQLDDGRCYLVMERLDGETLQQRMDRRPLDLAECIAILLPLCDALEAAHARAALHRDLKPANVHLSGAGDQVKLLDFDLAKLLDAKSGAADARSDVYALGVMAFQMLTRRLPFSGHTTREMLRRHIEEAPPRLREHWSTAQRPLETLLTTMLAKAPTARPSLSEVRRVLLQVSAGLGKARPRPRRWRWQALAAAIIFCGASVALAGAWIRNAPLLTAPRPPAARPLANTRPSTVRPPNAPLPRSRPRSTTGDELLDLFAQ